MAGTTSLRRRLVIGSFLWTFGLVFLTNTLSLAVVTRRISGGTQHIILMTSLALGLLIAALVQIRGVMVLFKRLQRHLNEVHEGREDRLRGEYPVEVQPVVSELNALLDAQEARVRRALAKAGDLAHGLKTPLAILGQESERLQTSGHEDAALVVRQQVDRMRRHVDYHLAQARAAASGATLGVSTSVHASVEGLVRTLRHLYAEKHVTMDHDIPAEARVRVQSEDLDEMLGNLLDNACKWGTQIRVTATAENPAVAILVDDDGPGIAPEMRRQVLQRGVRADEAAPGSGLGLAIVRDLAELHGGSIALEDSPMGGARARLVLPTSAAGHNPRL
jgi:signal transduction histidine kinase